MSRVPKFPGGTSKIFHIAADHSYVAYGKAVDFPGAFILTQEPIIAQVAINAWTHAVRYTAKGLDYPDYEAALQLLLERHPSWQVVGLHCPTVAIDLRNAGEDIPETN